MQTLCLKVALNLFQLFVEMHLCEANLISFLISRLKGNLVSLPCCYPDKMQLVEEKAPKFLILGFR